jgi:ParB family transcriptional regulator, chromosome partitioning protein
MAQRKQALGKGLSALLSGREPSGSQQTEETLSEEVNIIPVAGGIATVPVNAILTNPWQPRNHFEQEALEGLAESIRMHGLIQPITVRQSEAGQYELISGERRFRASQLAGLTEIPAYIRKADNQGMLEMALIENIHREDLNAMEVALSYQRLMEECNLTQEGLSERVAKKRSTITNYLRLLKLPAAIQSGIIEGSISMGHARALAGTEDEVLQLKTFQQIVEKGLSVRQVEALLSKDKSETKEKAGRPVSYKLEIPGLQSKIKQPARVEHNGSGGGKVSIPFLSKKELDFIISFLDNQ